MSDYTALKVPELKKLLQEKSLPITGNKADLIARLQEHDKSLEKPQAAAGTFPRISPSGVMYSPFPSVTVSNRMHIYAFENPKQAIIAY